MLKEEYINNGFVEVAIGVAPVRMQQDSSKDKIFVGDKEDTLVAFRQLVTHQTEWNDYSEKVLDIITTNGDDDGVN
eukprot:4628461-Ditylum_brightwellii.AAC.1